MSMKETQMDIITGNNQIISENLSKINEKLCKIKLSLHEEEENEYENFYNRINFYFSNIVTELKLSFVEHIKIYQLKESELRSKIQVNKNNLILCQSLESRNETLQIENLNKIQDLNVEKKQNSILSEKIQKQENEILKKNDYYKRNLASNQNFKKKYENSEKDVINLLMEKMLLKTELDHNFYLSEESKYVDVSQYVDYYGLNNCFINESAKDERRIKQEKGKVNVNVNLKMNNSSNSNIININEQKGYLTGSGNDNILNLKTSISVTQPEKSRNKIKESLTYINQTEFQEGRAKLNIIDKIKKSRSKDPISGYTTEKPTSNTTNNHFINDSITPTTSKNTTKIMKNYSTFINNFKTDSINNINRTPKTNHYSVSELYKEQDGGAGVSSIYNKTHMIEDRMCSNPNLINQTENKNLKSHSMISNYRNNASSIKDLKLYTLSHNNEIRSSNIKSNHSTKHKSFSSINNINLMSNLNLKTEIKLVKETRHFTLDSSKSQLLNNNNKIYNIKISSNNSLVNSITNTSNGNSNASNLKAFTSNTKLDKNLINSSVEFEKYKSSLLEKLNTNINFKKNINRVKSSEIVQGNSNAYINSLASISHSTIGINPFTIVGGNNNDMNEKKIFNHKVNDAVNIISISKSKLVKKWGTKEK